MSMFACLVSLEIVSVCYFVSRFVQSCQLILLLIAGAIARSQAFFGQGTGAILLDQVGCTGTETRLVDCSYNPIGVHDCSHTEDAGVTCQSTRRFHSVYCRIGV